MDVYLRTTRKTSVSPNNLTRKLKFQPRTCNFHFPNTIVHSFKECRKHIQPSRCISHSPLGKFAHFHAVDNSSATFRRKSVSRRVSFYVNLHPRAGLFFVVEKPSSSKRTDSLVIRIHVSFTRRGKDDDVLDNRLRRPLEFATE